MKGNNGLFIGIGALVLVGGTLFYFKNKNKKSTENENKALDDLTTSDVTKQATLLKNYLSVSKLPVVGYTANQFLSNKYGVMNVCNEITDFQAVQRKFSALCENEYTLMRAFETGLFDNQVNNALDLIRSQKVITTKETLVYILDSQTAEESSRYKKMPTNTILGKFLKSGIYTAYNDDRIDLISSYMFFNGYDTNNKPIYAFVEKKNATLITPQ